MQGKAPNYKRAISRCANCKFMTTYTRSGSQPMCNRDDGNPFEIHPDCVCDNYEPIPQCCDDAECGSDAFDGIQTVGEKSTESSQLEWARREIDLLIKMESDPGYAPECAESAFRAYRSLCADGHSGVSIQLVKKILDDLIDLKPLTPLTGEDDEWSLIDDGFVDGRRHGIFQNRRYGSLFKSIYPDGTVKYSDVDRFVCVDMDNPRNRFYNSFMAEKAGEAESKVAKIEFPYTPPRRPIEIWCEQLLADYANGSYYTIRLDSLRYTDPETGLHVQDGIDRCFKDDGTKMVEIPRSEWDERKAIAKDKAGFDRTHSGINASGVD